MVSQRQRDARKRFRDENPNLASKADATKGEPNSSSTKKKKKKNLKGKRTVKGVGGGGGVSKRRPDKSSAGRRSSKHPLRVPGMRPGENCFICKSKEHIAKHCPDKAQWEKHKICLLCRQRGHSLKNCPEKSDSSGKKLCYNCGEIGHSLSNCPLPVEDGGTKFASCFVCKEHGHLSKNCPKNTHGIYPKGGSCKICSGIDHLAKYCPRKSGNNPLSSTGMKRSMMSSANERKHIVFASGDDLEDDFVALDADGGSVKEVALPSSAPTEAAMGEGKKNTRLKQQKKQATKVVNFFG